MTNKFEVREYLKDIYEALVLLEPEIYDTAIMGVVERINGQPAVCYNKSKILGILMNDGIDIDGALEYYEYNILGSYMGEHTPVFMDSVCL